MNFLKRWMRKRKYGEPIVIVSGLPRSGTSMMMKMLEAGGLAPMTDNVREADVDNPKGYYEYERVKDLENEKDKSYIREGRGKVLKVISFLLKFLPEENAYKVIFMARDLDEVIASQNKMLHHREEANPIRDAEAKELYGRHLINVKVHCQIKDNFEYLEIPYRQALNEPEKIVRAVNEFCGGTLDAVAMGKIVDKNLYRNRKEDLNDGDGGDVNKDDGNKNDGGDTKGDDKKDGGKAAG